MSWAKCEEPHKSILDTLASHWIEGQLQDGSLALEILKLQTAITDSEREALAEKRRVPKELATARRELQILATALVESWDDSPNKFNAEVRRTWLETCIDEEAKRSQSGWTR